MSNEIVTWSSLLLVIATIFYVVFTWRMVREMQATRVADLRSYIVIDIKIHNQQFYLSIENRGKSPARNVTFRVDRDVEIGGRKNLRELPLIKDGVDQFPSNRRYLIRLGATYKFLGDLADGEKRFPKSFAISVVYSYLNEKRATETTVINLSEYLLTHMDVDAQADQLAELNETMKKTLAITSKGVDSLATLSAIAGLSGLEISHRTASLLSSRAEADIHRFDMNMLTHADLINLLGINYDLAARIVTCRFDEGGFESYDDLNKISGISEDVIAKLKTNTYISPRYLNKF